jgi:uncharacterized protein (TIGR02145 family)
MKKALVFLFSILCTGSVLAQTPVLNSNLSSSYVLLIDPDGYTDNSGWWGGGSVVAASAGYSVAQVTEVFTRVAEDFRPFDLNVTTDESVFLAVPVSNRQRVVLTPSDAFYNTGTTNAGGVAYLNTFGGGDISCWVFTNKMGGSAANAAEATSHELGHTLGLNHHATYNTDCSFSSGYHGGQGSGQTSWGPIMGAVYGRNITQWYNGAANGSTCTSYYQDDCKIITNNNGFTYKTDDVGDTRPSATTLTLASGAASFTGLISTNTDIDVFRFAVSASGVYSFSVTPNAHNASTYSGANLDARVTISNSAGIILTDAQPTTTLNVITHLYLNPGDYFVSVDGAGIAGYLVTGGLGPNDYGSVGQYTLNLNTVACSAGLLTTTSGERCGTGSVTLSASAGTGTISWFGASSGGTALGTGASFTTPSVSTTTSYYVEFANGTCTSARVPVNATISYPPVLPPITGSNTIQVGTPLQLSNPFQGGTWSTSNSNMATVSETGLVMPLAAGSVTISYSATSGSCAAASVSLAVAITSPQPCVGIPTVTDADGNIYNTVQIGGQCWTKENLKTTRYADNTVIPGVSLDASWSALSTGAWASYSNNANLEASYGKLYNQFAVSDSRLLCPVGWHIPDSTEIQPLMTYLAGSQAAGGKMKQVSVLWTQPNVSGTNYSGFSALPGGQRDAAGLFSGISTNAGFWTKSIAGSNGVQFTLQNSSGSLSTSFISRKAGLSVRCIQDNGGTGTGPRILEAISSSRCGPGILILQAFASGGEVTWFASPQGGNALAMGTYFTTPELTQTTTYYVAAVSGTLASARTPVYAIVNPAFDPGYLEAGDQTICSGGDPSAISFAENPTGATNYTYQWYYQDGLAGCPSGTSLTGWTAISGAKSSSYDPPSGLTISRSYAVFVAPVAGVGSVVCGEAQWAPVCRKVIVLSTVVSGTLATGNQSITNPADPASIVFSTASSGGSGLFSFQWYYQDGIVAAPTGSVLTGWTLIQGATANSYDPPAGQTVSRSFACLVTPAGSPVCGTAAWASGVRQITVTNLVLNPGILVTGNQTICNAGDPSVILFSAAPSGPAGIGYQWYFQDGIIPAPTGVSTNGWTLIAGATASSYDPPVGLISSRSYACLVSASGVISTWASGVRQLTVLPVFTPGIITAGDQSFCSSGDPANITLLQNPTGSGAYTWRWYFRETATGTCPTGSTVPVGWNTNSTSANITGTTTTGAGISFDPMNAGAVNVGRTFAVLITPVANGSVPACGAPQWAESCRKTFVTSCSNFVAGSLASGNQTLCNGGDPSAIAFSVAPSGGTGYGYQWYFQAGIATAPTGSVTTGWTLITGATASSYDPPTGLAASRSFACMVSATGVTARWATGVRQVSVLSAVSNGSVSNGNESLIAPADPSLISLFTLPTGGSGFFTYQWYFQDGIAAAPTGSSVLGWNLILDATTSSYNPPAGLLASRSYACLISPSGSPVCGSAFWASGVRQVTVTTSVTINPGTLTAGNQTICNAGDPNAILFGTAPSGIASFNYQWYYQDGIVASPSGNNTTGWTLISGASVNSFDPPSGLTTSRTYACLVSGSGAVAAWASGVRQVTVLPVFNPGAIAAGDQTFCNSGNPANITMSVNPVGSGGYQWKWWYFENANATCPTTGSAPAGWLSNTSSTNITGTTLTGAGVMFDPISAGAVGSGRTFAVLITPIANGIVPACGTPKFAANCRKLFVNACRQQGADMASDLDPKVQFSVVPNPVSEVFSLMVTGLERDQIVQIDVLDATGKRIFSKEETLASDELKMDASGWAKGMYQLVIRTSTNIWTERFVK